MEYVKLGNSDLRVSRICLGCMGFGDATIGQHSWTIGEEPTREIIRRSLELGVNFFDTAIAYQLGTSEQFVGRALRDMAKREDVVVATKLHHIEGAVKSLDVHLSADDIRYLEEPYVPHYLSGVMAVNKPVMNEEPVWVKASKDKSTPTRGRTNQKKL